jgi:hypothetical protein
MSAAGLASAAYIPGLDYRPADQAGGAHVVLANATVFDAIMVSGSPWVLYKEGTSVKVDVYDTVSGELSGAPTTILTPNVDTGSYEKEGIHGANVALCSPRQATGQTLTQVSGATYSLPNIGIAPPTIQVTGTGGSCPAVQVAAASFVDGRKTTTTTTTDRVDLANRGSCTAFTASYTYTNCSLADPYTCKMADGSGDDGYCKLMMVYEAWADTDNDSSTPKDRHLLGAYSQEMDSGWARYLPGSSTPALPDAEDVLIANRAPHEGSTTDDVYSFAGVPELVWDPGLGLWRMWFVTEGTGIAPIHYAESSDDGQTWGITSYNQPNDCYDTTANAYDTAACTLLAWSTGGSPPNYSATSKNPDTVDPGVVDLNGTLHMFVTGADRGCGSGPELAVILRQGHGDWGDQSGGARWTWDSSVEEDGTDGVVLEEDASICEWDDSSNDGDDQVGDPTPLKIATGKYALFFQMDGGIHVAGSGFQCSNWTDDDAGGGTDYPDDVGCDSPTDDTE